MHTAFTWALTALTVLACLQPASAQPEVATSPLPTGVQQALQQAGLPADALAAVALPLPSHWLSRWQRPWGHQAQRSMQPASTMKLVTSIVALDRLGPNLRGSTELRTAATISADGTLQGDLVLKGGADPELGVAQFWALLQELRASGVHTITGQLIVDRSLWRPARMDVGLPAFDAAPEFAYNVIPDALQLNENLLPLRLASNGEQLNVSTVPELPGLKLSHRMQLIEGRCGAWAAGWQPAQLQRDAATQVISLELHGQFPRNCTVRTALQLIDRQDFTAAVFASLWQQLGGRWLGQAVEGEEPAGSRVLARRVSRPWGEVLRTLNKQSDNALTRMLFLNLGVAGMVTHPELSTAEIATRVVLRWMADHGIQSDGVVLDNGSGLSRSERISPAQLAAMLKVAHGARYAPDFVMSLPVPGVDGTMRNRLKESPAAGWARLKTGTLRNVTSLAGYLTDASGQAWAVALMINHEQAHRGRPALDLLIDHMVRQGPHGGNPYPAP